MLPHLEFIADFPHLGHELGFLDDFVIIDVQEAVD